MSAAGAPREPPFDLVLASASPRRRELLERLGLRLRLEPVDVDETPLPGEAAVDCARRLAAAKCDAAVARLGEPAEPVAVLAADTVVTVDRRILGKAADADAARDMLALLASRRHEVVTAYRIRRGAAPPVERAVSTVVAFRLIDPPELDAYLASGEWRGKAGAYAIQGIAGVFATELRGSHTNVIGLPLSEVIADLRAAGALPRYPPAAFGTPA